MVKIPHRSNMELDGAVMKVVARDVNVSALVRGILAAGFLLDDREWKAYLKRDVKAARELEKVQKKLSRRLEEMSRQER